jgi:hypothetical protein
MVVGALGDTFLRSPDFKPLHPAVIIRLVLARHCQRQIRFKVHAEARFVTCLNPRTHGPSDKHLKRERLSDEQRPVRTAGNGIGLAIGS